MIPNSRTIQEALVDLLTRRGPTKSSDAYQLLQRPLRITKADLSLKTSDGKSRYKYTVRWAKKALMDSGIIKRPNESEWGLWEINSSSLLCKTSEELEKATDELGVVTSKPNGQRKPRMLIASTTSYYMDAFVAAYVLTIAGGKCEACDKSSPFLKPNGTPYLEVHHLRHLADQGADTVENVVGVCPNCHRELHHGQKAESVKEFLYRNIDRLVRE